MAKGNSRISTWDHWVSVLMTKRSRFRMIQRKGTQFIQIREIENGEVVRQFSSGIYRPEIDEDIAACAAQCIAASQGTGWVATSKPADVHIGLTWELIADSALENLRARIARVGSRKNAEGHLAEIAKLTGPVTAKALEKWTLQRDPVTQPSAFRNRIEMISHFNKAGDLRLDESLVRR